MLKSRPRYEWNAFAEHALCIRRLAEIFIAFSNVRRCHCGKSTCSRSRFFFSLPFLFLFFPFRLGEYNARYYSVQSFRNFERILFLNFFFLFSISLIALALWIWITVKVSSVVLFSDRRIYIINDGLIIEKILLGQVGD